MVAMPGGAGKSTTPGSVGSSPVISVVADPGTKTPQGLSPIGAEQGGVHIFQAETPQEAHEWTRAILFNKMRQEFKQAQAPSKPSEISEDRVAWLPPERIPLHYELPVLTMPAMVVIEKQGNAVRGQVYLSATTLYFEANRTHAMDMPRSSSLGRSLSRGVRAPSALVGFRLFLSVRPAFFLLFTFLAVSFAFPAAILSLFVALRIIFGSFTSSLRLFSNTGSNLFGHHVAEHISILLPLFHLSKQR